MDEGTLKPYQEGPEAWDVRLRLSNGDLTMPVLRPHRMFGTEAEAQAWIYGFTAAPRLVPYTESDDARWS